MSLLFIVIHVVISVLLILTILLQRSNSDALKGLGSAPTTGVMSAQATSNFLHKTTVVLSALFIINCIVMANMSAASNKKSGIEKILEQKDGNREQQQPVSAPIAN
jgi:preprotein translocase subunit SecG